MVPKIGTGRGIQGLVAYVTHDKGHASTSERVAWLHSENLATTDPRRAAAIMIATTRAADQLKAEAGVKATGRKIDKTVIHLSLSWPPDTKPDQATMIAAGRQAMKSLGVEDHQALMVAHNDEEHPHVHLVIGRVHPVSGKAAPLSNDRLALSRWAESWERTHEGIRCDQRVENNARRDLGEFVRYEPPTAQEIARQAVRYIGAEAFQAACREMARPALWEASSREDADRRLAALGLHIENVKRGGQIITDGTHQAKLSEVAAGLVKLERAWRNNTERSPSSPDAADADVDRKDSRRERAPVAARGEDRGVAAAPDAPGKTGGTEQAGPARAAAHRGERGAVGAALDTGALERAPDGVGSPFGAAPDRIGQRPDPVSRDPASRTPESRAGLDQSGARRDSDRGSQPGRDPQTAEYPILAGGWGVGVRADSNRPTAGHADAGTDQAGSTAISECAAIREHYAATVAAAITRTAEASEHAIAAAEHRQWLAIAGTIAIAARSFAAGLRREELGYLGQHSGSVSSRSDHAAGGVLGAAEECGRVSDGEERRPVHDYAIAAGWTLGRLARSPVDVTQLGYRVWRKHEDRRLLARYEVRAYAGDDRVGIWDRQGNHGHGQFVDEQAPAQVRKRLATPMAVEQQAQKARQEAHREARRLRAAEDARAREAAQARTREALEAKERELAEIKGFTHDATVSAGSEPGRLVVDWPDSLPQTARARRSAR